MVHLEVKTVEENREKQIKELAQLIGDSCTIHKVHVNKHYPDRQKDMYYSLAEELLKHYQPKLSEGNIVILKDDYEAMQTKIEQLTKYAENERQLREYYCNKAIKETVKRAIDFIETLRVKEDGRHQWREDHNDCIDKVIFKLNLEFMNSFEIKE